MVEINSGEDPKKAIVDAIDQQLDCASQFPEETAPVDLKRDFKLRSDMARTALTELLESIDEPG